MIIIDALEECDDEVRDMVAFFENLGEMAASSDKGFHVLFSSRHYPHITVQRCVEMTLEDQRGHSEDIEKYLARKLRTRKGQPAEQIRQEIQDRASGVFMWVVLIVQILNKASDHNHADALRKKLREIPDGLKELFKQTFTRDCQNMEEMKLCFQWILYASRPLRPEEPYFAILSGTEPEAPFLWNPEYISREDIDLFILSSSKGLAEITTSTISTVQFIHESVTDFLSKRIRLGHLWQDQKGNDSGVGHNRLKDCCLNLMNHSVSNIDYPLGLADPISPLPVPIAHEERTGELVRFPAL